MKKTENIITLARTISDTLQHRFSMPDQHAWWILEEITKKSKEQLLITEKITLTDAQQEQLNRWIEKLTKENIPLQYLIGSVPFIDLDILVEPPVLIPRPETEEWCRKLINDLAPLEDKKLLILDLCTGSGCIALALAKALPAAQIYATDISKKAIALARKNAIHNKINNVTCLVSDLFDSLSESFTFDLIVANPPYIPETEWQKLSPSVTQWEDKNALIAPQNGVALIEKIIARASTYLKNNKEIKQHNLPQLLIEIDHTQGQKVKKIMEQHHFVDVQICKDLAGKDRVACGRINSVATTENKK